MVGTEKIPALFSIKTVTVPKMQKGYLQPLQGELYSFPYILFQAIGNHDRFSHAD
jgi:hypothetical protein